MALLGLESRDDADDLRARLHAVFLGQRAARLLVVVAVEVDAVVDEPDRDGRPLLVDELVLDRARDGDQPVHVRRQVAQELPGPRAIGPGSSGPSTRGTAGDGRSRRARGPPACATVSARYMWAWTTSARTSARWAASAPTAIASSGSSMTRTGIPARWSLRTALPGRQRHDRDVVALVVDPGHERLEVLLGAAIGAGREDLDDADPAAGEHRSLDRLEAGVRWRRGGHLSWSFVGRGGAGSARRPRPTRTCRARRRAGSPAGACPAASARST